MSTDFDAGPVLPFTGRTVLVTGDVPGLSREAAKAAIVALGGKAMASVSSKTGLVVIGEGAGVSKMAKTRGFDLDVIDAETFAALVADPGSWDGTHVGEPVSVFDARHAPAEPDPVEDEPYVPMSQRHLTGDASNYPIIDGVIVKQYLRWCQCGHRWRAKSVTSEKQCPLDPATKANPTQ